jgi:hypothetical protein
MDIRKLKDNTKYVYGSFPLGSAKVSDSAHMEIVHNIRAAGIDTQVIDQVLHFSALLNSCDLPIDGDDMIALLQSGLYINSLPMGAVMAKTTLQDVTPTGLPMSVKTNEDETTEQMTWEEWFAAQGNNNVYTEAPDSSVIAFGTHYSGKVMDSNHWLTMLGTGKIQLKPKKEYQALLKSWQPEIEEL